MKREFKVGDTVVVNEDAEELCRTSVGIGWNSMMSNTIGKRGVVDTIGDDTYYVTFDGVSGWCYPAAALKFSDEMTSVKTNRDLLVAAARAAKFDLSGYEWLDEVTPTPWCQSAGITFFWGFAECKLGVTATWNPLTNDGDALRLAVALGLVVMAGGQNVEVISSDGFTVSVYDQHDAYYATRLAIVKCAASIGLKQK